MSKTSDPERTAKSRGKPLQVKKVAKDVSQREKTVARFAVDANFFILAFAQNPKELRRFKKIADRVAFKLYTSPQVLQELRGRLRHQVKNVVETLEIPDEELQDYINKAKDVVERIPQAPDLSLLLVLKKLNEQQLVSSDFQLLQSLRSLEPEIEGLMGSAFLLHLLERSHDFEEDFTFLEELRERVLHTEIKYSLTRSSVFDPTTRIKLIENQAFHIIRSLRGPRIAEEDLIGMSAQEALGLRTFLEELRRRYADLINKIHAQNYRETLIEATEARDELYSHLMLLAWELAATAHRRLTREITPDMVLLNYIIALGHLYLGEQDGLTKAMAAIEESNRILLTVRPSTATYRRLMIMTHLLRITINLILEDFKAATMYFTLFARKTQEWGFSKEQTTAQALRLALAVISGEDAVTEFPRVEDPEEVFRFLVDLASIYFMLRRFDEAWRILNQVVNVVMYFDLVDGLESILRQMTLVYYADGCQREAEYVSLVTMLETWLQERNHDVTHVNNLKTELTGEAESSPEYFTEESLPSKQLHTDLQDWMTVIDRVDTVLLEGSILIGRSWKLGWNVALLIQGVEPEEKAKGGEQVRLGEGKFKVTQPPPSLKDRYRIFALIHADPTEKSRIYVRGGQGFRLLELGSLLDTQF